MKKKQTPKEPLSTIRIYQRYKGDSLRFIKEPTHLKKSQLFTVYQMKQLIKRSQDPDNDIPIMYSDYFMELFSDYSHFPYIIIRAYMKMCGNDMMKVIKALKKEGIKINVDGTTNMEIIELDLKDVGRYLLWRYPFIIIQSLVLYYNLDFNLHIVVLSAIMDVFWSSVLGCLNWQPYIIALILAWFIDSYIIILSSYVMLRVMEWISRYVVDQSFNRESNYRFNMFI